MEEMLKVGFTLVFNGEYDNISGGYLKKRREGNDTYAFKRR